MGKRFLSSPHLLREGDAFFPLCQQSRREGNYPPPPLFLQPSHFMQNRSCPLGEGSRVSLDVRPTSTPGVPLRKRGGGEEGGDPCLAGGHGGFLTVDFKYFKKVFALSFQNKKETFCFVNDSFNRYLLQTEYEYKSMPPRCCPFPPDMRRPLCDPPSAISRRKRSETTMEKEGRVHDGD